MDLLKGGLGPFVEREVQSLHGPREGLTRARGYVFDDEVAARHFLGVARGQMQRARVDLPLWVSHRTLLEREGPLGAAWRGVRGDTSIGKLGGADHRHL